MNSLNRELSKFVQLAEQEALQHPHDGWYPHYHLAPPVGWLNDPNGLCYFAGEYHAFFQYSPFSAEGGLKFWGHCVSRDLQRWTYLGAPLLADQPFDCHGVYSGSAMVDDGVMDIFYTGNVKESGDFDYVKNGRQGNLVHVSSVDGKHFGPKKWLMERKDYPQDCSCHIRDPKVWKEEDGYYMVLGARTMDDEGQVLLYYSPDKESWTLKNRLRAGTNLGYMWECPDLFTLDARVILSISPQGVEHEAYRFQNVYQSGYAAVQGDYKGECRLEGFREWDYGFDFYAPQTFADERGRRILIGWMGMPDVPEFRNPTVELGWQHMFTLPRELRYQDGLVYQMPVQEILDRKQGLWAEVVKGGKVHPVSQAWELELTNEGYGSFTIELGGGLTLDWNAEARIVCMKFTGSSGGGRTMRQMKLESCAKLQIFADSSSLECFFNHGEAVMSTRYYPEMEERWVRVSKDVDVSYWDYMS